MERELIKRYTYAVTQMLPEQQRADIEKELNGLIEDMLEDRTQGREATEKDVEAVLLELGAPTVLADQYRGYQRYLIGPKLFPTYLTILKIVLMAIGIAMVVLFTVQTILTPEQVLEHFANSLVTFLMGCFQGFAWVTVIFGLVEYTGVQKGKIEQETAQEWSLADLPNLPADERRIHRGEPTFSIIFTVLFTVLITASVHLFGVWIFQNNEPALVVPFFNEAVFRGFVPFIWAVAAVSVLNEVIKLITGKWTMWLVGFEALTNILSFALALFMFSNLAIWNPSFMQQMAQAGLTPTTGEGYQTVSAIWAYVTANFVYFIGVVFAIQLISLAVKAFRMKNVMWKDQAAILID